MALSVYVDGGGGPDSGFGYFVKESGESFYEKKPGITNNQAEYMAIIADLFLIVLYLLRQIHFCIFFYYQDSKDFQMLKNILRNQQLEYKLY